MSTPEISQTDWSEAIEAGDNNWEYQYPEQDLEPDDLVLEPKPIALETDSEDPVRQQTPEGTETYEPGYTSDSLQLFMNEIGKTPLLKPFEEVQLAKRFEAGRMADKKLAKMYPDGHENVIPISEESREELEELLALSSDGLAAKQHMILANMRLVVSIAKRYRALGLPLQDLIQEGSIGLNRAVEKYDWRKGFKFSTYATWWVRQAVNRAVADKSKLIRMPVHVVERSMKIGRAQEDLLNRLGREPTIEELAERVGCRVDEVQTALDALHYQPTSLNIGVGNDKEIEVMDLISSTSLKSASEDEVVLDSLMADADGQTLRLALSSLTRNERRVLELRYGLEGNEMTLQEVGDILGVTREWIRQVEQRALRRLAANQSLREEFSDGSRVSDDSFRPHRVQQAKPTTDSSEQYRRTSPVKKSVKSQDSDKSDPFVKLTNLVDGKEHYLVSQLLGIGSQDGPTTPEELARHYRQTPDQIQGETIAGVIKIRTKAKNMGLDAEPLIDQIYEALFR